MKKIIAILSLLIVLMCGVSYAEEVDTNKSIKVNKYITDSLGNVFCSRECADLFYGLRVI